MISIMAFKGSAALMVLVAVVVMLVIVPDLADADGGVGGSRGNRGNDNHESSRHRNGGGGGGSNGRHGGGRDREDENGQHGGGGRGGGNGHHGGGGGGGRDNGHHGGGRGGGSGGNGNHGGGRRGGGGNGHGHGGGGGDNGHHSGGGHGEPDCDGYLSMCGDPKIIGGDGVMFYFHGRMNQDFCLVSDSDIHINAHFIGKRPERRHRDFTWVQALGFISGPRILTIAAKKVAQWDSQIDQLELSYNGQLFELEESWTSPDAVMTLNRISATNSVDLVVEEKMGVALTVVPIGEKENQVHNYGITDDDCFAHFDMQFRFYNLSSSVNGVLGQTYQPGYVSPVRRDVAMPVMGGADRFVSSSLAATDCRTSQYTAKPIAVGSAMPSFKAECGSSGLPNGVPGGITCRR